VWYFLPDHCKKPHDYQDFTSELNPRNMKKPNTELMDVKKV